jgi:hypothetical protein
MCWAAGLAGNLRGFKLTQAPFVYRKEILFALNTLPPEKVVYGSRNVAGVLLI